MMLTKDYWFQRALKKFKGDVKLWLQYIEYSKCCGHKQSLSRTFGRVLAIHPNKPGMFVHMCVYVTVCVCVCVCVCVYVCMCVRL